MTYVVENWIINKKTSEITVTEIYRKLKKWIAKITDWSPLGRSKKRARRLWRSKVAGG